MRAISYLTPLFPVAGKMSVRLQPFVEMRDTVCTDDIAHISLSRCVEFPLESIVSVSSQAVKASGTEGRDWGEFCIDR